MSSKICSKCLLEKPITDFYQTERQIRNVCKACTSIEGSKRYQKNKLAVDERNKLYAEKNRDRLRKASRQKINKRKEEDQVFKYIEYIRWNLNNAIRRNINKMKFKLPTLLGTTIEKTRDHLDITAINRYGFIPENVEIDHIIPLFTAKTIEDVERLNHYTNLQYLTREDNRKKGNGLNIS